MSQLSEAVESVIILDDAILDHPKFIRAVRLGGSDAIHMWLGLRAYCAKRLTDGFIEPDMYDEPRGPKGEQRGSAILSLRDSGLVHDPQERVLCLQCKSATEAKEGLWLHDYLQWTDSREAILARREKNKERQRAVRGLSQRDSQNSGARVDHPLPNLTIPNLTSPVESARGRARAPRGRQGGEIALPPDLQPTPEHQARAKRDGLELIREFEKFKANAEAKGLLYKNWNAAFTTWLMNAVEFRARSGAYTPRQEVLAPSRKFTPEEQAKRAAEVAERAKKMYPRSAG